MSEPAAAFAMVVVVNNINLIALLIWNQSRRRRGNKIYNHKKYTYYFAQSLTRRDVVVVGPLRCVWDFFYTIWWWWTKTFPCVVDRVPIQNTIYIYNSVGCCHQSEIIYLYKKNEEHKRTLCDDFFVTFGQFITFVQYHTESVWCSCLLCTTTIDFSSTIQWWAIYK